MIFTQIEEINKRWLIEQEEFLEDSQVLISELDQESGILMKQCICNLKALNFWDKNRIYKDPMFLNWYAQLNQELFYQFENQHGTWTDKTLLNGLELISKAVSDLATYKSAFLFFPQVEGIKIVNVREDLFINEGAEYDVNFDFDIDENTWIANLIGALNCIKLDSDTHNLIKCFVSYIVPLKQKALNRNLSLSSRNLPNVIFKNLEETSYVFGETLVHEADHQFMYAIEKFYSFWKEEVKMQQPIYRSPWRDDARPLDGILKGLSAFTRVSNYYSNIIETTSNREIDKIGSLLLTRLSECDVAITTLLNSNQLTDFGTKYVSELNSILHHADTIARKFAEYENWKLDALNVLKIHKTNWENRYNK